MIELEEAIQRVVENTRPNNSETVPISASVYRVLAEDVHSDVDAPPHDKAMMDGFAVRSEDVTSDDTVLTIAGTITAGEVAKNALESGCAYRIMTGAPLPPGADAVVMRELTNDPPSDQDTVTIGSFPIAPEQNVMRQASTMKKGQTVLRKGTRIRPAELGVMAEVGHLQVATHRTPSVAVLATGNELVPINATPGEGKIRNSNGPMLCAAARTLFASASNLGIAPDDASQLEQLIKKGLEQDIVIISGGVSAGDLDLVPATLKKLEVHELFHKVRIKPGKPVWFGTSKQGKTVFGLPGNPVSSLVCFHLLVAPAIHCTSGRTWDGHELQTGCLNSAHEHTGERRTFRPGRLQRQAEGIATIDLLPWKGSSDLLAMTSANCLVDFAEPKSYEAGAHVRYLALD